jgi:DNA-binding GntR family transcriptional regulator
METSQLYRVSVADQVAAILRQRILDGDLRPGTPLQEIPLSSSLGVSRNTMREAMRILSMEGLLKRSLHRGVAVSQLSLDDVQEIYYLRRMLEIPAVLAAKRRDRTILDELEAALHGYERAVRHQDWVGAVGYDFQFHSSLLRFHRNKRLESFHQNLIRELRMGMVLVDRRHDNPDALIPVHRKLFQLLSDGKLKQCAAMLARHLDDSESRLTRVMNGQTLQRNGQPVTRPEAKQTATQ